VSDETHGGRAGGRFDVVFALNFGLPADLPANRIIAEAARRSSQAHQIPIFSAPAGIFDFAGHPTSLSGDFPGYVSTVKQVDALTAAAQTHGWRRVLVVAAPPHAWRALRDVRAAGFIAQIDRSVFGEPRRIWYAKESEHRQTTAAWRWWLTWELPARAVILLRRPWYEARARR
jgi:hypothetical protein